MIARGTTWAGRTPAPCRPPLDSSLRTVVPRLVAWLLAGIRGQVVVLDNIELLACRDVFARGHGGGADSQDSGCARQP